MVSVTALYSILFVSYKEENDINTLSNAFFLYEPDIRRESNFCENSFEINNIPDKGLEHAV